MGTALKVGPFNSIPSKVNQTVPQVLINNQKENVRGGDRFTKEGEDSRLFI